jgi:hypothetical protein
MEQAYWLSQVTIPLALIAVAIWAGMAAYKQVNTLKLFEFLKYAHGEDFRHARRVVIQQIEPIQDTMWWETDLTLEASASDCCAHYDVLGRVLMFGKEKKLARVLDPWGPSITRTYKILLPFMDVRRTTGGPDFGGYEWLYRRAALRMPSTVAGRQSAQDRP